MDEDYIDIESEEVDLHVQQELVGGVSVSVAWQQPTGPGFKSLELMRGKAEKDFYENVALPSFAAIRSARVKGIDQYKLELEVENGLSCETEKMWYYIQVLHRKDGHKGRLTYNEVFGGKGKDGIVHEGADVIGWGSDNAKPLKEMKLHTLLAGQSPAGLSADLFVSSLRYYAQLVQKRKSARNNAGIRKQKRRMEKEAREALDEEREQVEALREELDAKQNILAAEFEFLKVQKGELATLREALMSRERVVQDMEAAASGVMALPFEGTVLAMHLKNNLS